MSKPVRIAGLTVASVAFVYLIILVIRYFLGHDISRLEQMIASGIVAVGVAALATLVAQVYLDATIEPNLRRLVQPLGVVGLVNIAPEPRFTPAISPALKKYLVRGVGLAALAILAITDPVGTYARGNSRMVMTVLYITDRDAGSALDQFSNAPHVNGALAYGKALVLAPITPVSSGGISYSLRHGKSNTYEISEGSVSVMTEDAFFDTVKGMLRSSSDEFVLVPGFHTSFTDSLLRIGQLAHDLKLRGAPIVFSWPSGNVYTADKENAVWAVKHLRQTLADLKSRTAPDHMNVVAHSMGSLLLGEALDGLTLGDGSFDNVVFAAPDVNEAMFAQFSDAAKKIARRVTVYVSHSDGALFASNIIQADRVGSVVVSRPGIDVIDAADVDRPASLWGMLGHSYLFDSDLVLFDLSGLIGDSRPADQRVGTVPAGPAGCWRLQPRQAS